jgi:hypothetical protein
MPIRQLERFLCEHQIQFHASCGLDDCAGIDTAYFLYESNAVREMRAAFVESNLSAYSGRRFQSRASLEQCGNGIFVLLAS